jgi:hypothetical protein
VQRLASDALAAGEQHRPRLAGSDRVLNGVLEVREVVDSGDLEELRLGSSELDCAQDIFLLLLDGPNLQRPIDAPRNRKSRRTSEWDCSGMTEPPRAPYAISVPPSPRSPTSWPARSPPTASRITGACGRPRLAPSALRFVTILLATVSGEPT